MDIILKTPIEELTPQLIAFNNEELIAQAKAYLEKYENMLFDDDSIAEAKEVKAEINKKSSELNKWRIAIQRYYETPSKNFKSQVDEVIALFDNVSKKIGVVVDDYTERVKAEKRDKITALYNEIFGSHADIVTLDMIYNSKWENKSYGLNLIEEDIRDWFGRIMQDLEAIYSMNDVNQIELKLLYLKSLNLGVALSEYKREEQRKAFLKEKEAERVASVIDWSAKVEKPVTSEPTPLKEPYKEPSTEEKLYTLSFRCELTKNQANALKQFLINNNIKYEKI